MRNIQAEKRIEKILATRFDLDTAQVDVTVLGEEAEVTGVFLARATGAPVSDLQSKDIQRFFNSNAVEGVRRYVFHLRSAHATF